MIPKSGISFYPEGSHGFKGLAYKFWSILIFHEWSVSEFDEVIWIRLFHSHHGGFQRKLFEPQGDFAKQIFNSRNFRSNLWIFLVVLGWSDMPKSFRKGWTTPININMSMFREIFHIHLRISTMKVDSWNVWKFSSAWFISTVLLVNQELNVLHLLPDKPARNGAPKGGFPFRDCGGIDLNTIYICCHGVFTDGRFSQEM